MNDTNILFSNDTNSLILQYTEILFQMKNA